MAVSSTKHTFTLVNGGTKDVYSDDVTSLRTGVLVYKDNIQIAFTDSLLSVLATFTNLIEITLINGGTLYINSSDVGSVRTDTNWTTIVYRKKNYYVTESKATIDTRIAAAQTVSAGFLPPIQLTTLTDVNTATPTNRNVLVADGTDWESRALTKADISDFGEYFTLASGGTSTGTLVSLDTEGSNFSLIQMNAPSSGDDAYVYVLSNTGGDGVAGIGINSANLVFDTDSVLGVGGVKFIDARVAKVGIEYSADYSADFTDRSLVDKGWVLSLDHVTASGTPIDNQLAIWTSADEIEGTSAATFDGRVLTVTATEASFALDGGTRTGVMITEVGGEIVDFGTNYEQSLLSDLTNRGAFFRIDTRASSANQLFGIIYQPTGVSATEQLVFQVSNAGAMVTQSNILVNGDINLTGLVDGVDIAALLTTFNGVSELVQLDGSGNLPALDGSALTNLTMTPAGSTTQLQYNNGGALGALSAVTWSGTQLEVSSSLHIDSGGALELAGQHTTYKSGVNEAAIYISGSGGGSYPFNLFGNLILQSRTNGSADIVFSTGTSGNTRGFIARDGTWGIGYTDYASLNGGYKAEVNGDMYVDGTLTVNGGFASPLTVSDVTDPTFLINLTDTSVIDAQNVGRVAWKVNDANTGGTTEVGEISMEFNDNTGGGPSQGTAGEGADLILSTGYRLVTGDPMILNEQIRIDKNGVIIVANMPTSTTGLATGSLWSDSGTIKIV